MNLIDSLVRTVAVLVPTAGTALLVVLGLLLLNWLLKRRWRNNPDAQFRYQLIMLTLTFAGGLAVILALPVNDSARGQLLSLIGILLSAAIALSSTTFIGNIMAGIMLKAVKSARPGDFITVADLTDSFVHVRQLGDFSVTYRVAGLLEDVKSLISARSRLRESMLDALHAAGIEIVSPNFMNTRSLADDQSFVPIPVRRKSGEILATAESLAFDKAEEASLVEQIRKSVELVDAELAALDKAEPGTTDPSEDELAARKVLLIEQLRVAEERRKAAEIAEHAGSEP